MRPLIESDFRHPPLRVSVRTLEAHFESDRARARNPLRNPHHEPPVDADARRRATPAAVLIPIVVGAEGLSVLLTRRHESISYGGHICFPGGRCDPADAGPEQTALREAEEEIALDPRSVRLIGRLGDYVTHSGFRIQPVVGLVTPPLRLTPRFGEVEEILEVPLDTVLDSRSYRLRESVWTKSRESTEARAHFYLEHGGAIVAGPTVSLMMGLYEELLAAS